MAKLILKDRPSTGRLLNILEEKKLIERFVDTKNNRLVKKMRLTTEGHDMLERASRVIKNYMDTLPNFLSEEDIETLKVSIQKFRNGLEKEVEMNI